MAAGAVVRVAAGEGAGECFARAASQVGWGVNSPVLPLLEGLFSSVRLIFRFPPVAPPRGVSARFASQRLYSAGHVPRILLGRWARIW